MTLGSGVVTKLWLHECVRSAAKRIVTAAFMLHCFFGEGSRSTKPCIFRVKWLRPAMKGTSCARRVRSVRFGVRLVP